jgi:polar amino acid transport system permease protein
MDWSWFPKFIPLLLLGIWNTLTLLVGSCAIGIVLAIGLGLAQISRRKVLAWPALWFCTLIRGTPLLIQLYLLYYALGSLFPSIPWIRHSFVWPVLREGYFYALLAFSLSYAGYEGEVMRGAFLGVPRGELEAARAFGMSPWKVLHRIWLPRAFMLVFPTLSGETMLQLKSIPLASLVTVYDLFGATTVIRQTTFRVYEPLLLALAVYIALFYIINSGFKWLERRIPQKR